MSYVGNGNSRIGEVLPNRLQDLNLEFITTDQHCSASIIEVRPVRIQQALEDGYIAIVAGFQGMSTKLEVTTLGRGGSDTTAVALTAALNATYCEICSDVSGVYSTDPRVVSSARLLDELSFGYSNCNGREWSQSLTGGSTALV